MNPFNNSQSLNTYRSPVTNKSSKTGMSWNGKEYRGPAMDIKSTDPASAQPHRSFQNPQAKVFNMEDAEDVKLYTEVMRDVVHNKIHVGVKHLLPDRVPFCIFLEWYEDVYVAPEK